MIKMVIKKLKSPRLKEFLIYLIDPFFKKKRNKLIFVIQDQTFFSGNIRVMCEFYLSHNKDDQIFIYKDGKCQPDIRRELQNLGIQVLDNFSFITIYHIVTAGVIFLSHNPRNIHIRRKFKNRFIINLWHGVAIKRIENIMQFIPYSKQKLLNNHAKLYDMIIASSDADRKTNARAFGVKEELVKVTGLPRYEILKKSYFLGSVLQKEEQRIKNIKGKRKLVLYAPTFREANISAFGQITFDEWYLLDKFAEQNNILIGLRPHPYDNFNLFPIITKNKNFYLFKNIEFTEPNLLLRYVDLLIVDFTSIWVDYLLLDRPILGFAKDYRNYLKKERGFVYNFEEIFPDIFTNNMIELLNQLSKKLSSNKVDYTYTKNILHKYDLYTNYSKLVYQEVEKLRRKIFD
jgi:CDP-glycerol glycerophosphotransferase (TagB/SpsB family)